MVSRGDALRYFALHKYGGVYIGEGAERGHGGAEGRAAVGCWLPLLPAGVQSAGGSALRVWEPTHRAHTPPLRCPSPNHGADLDTECFREGYDLLRGADVVLQARRPRCCFVPVAVAAPRVVCSAVPASAAPADAHRLSNRATFRPPCLPCCLFLLALVPPLLHMHASLPPHASLHPHAAGHRRGGGLH